MRRLPALILILLASFGNAQSPWDVPESVARTIAINGYSERTSAEIPASELVLSVQKKAGLYLVISINPAHFTLVSGDYRAWPILAWGDGIFPSEPSQVPSSFEWLIASYQTEMAGLNGQPDSLVMAEWQRLSAPSPGSRSLISVSPMLTTLWGQGCKYNAECPLDSASTGYYCYHVPAGCVATALSQIMRYWKYPLSGTGSHAYVHANYGSLSANFSSTVYDWALMPNNPPNSLTGIPKLIYHIGVSVNMAYGPQSSGSYANDARASLVNYFNYDASAVYRQKVSYTDPQWHALLKAELDFGRPVFYGGLDPNGYGGHAWVVDGYQGQYYHINWGWDGALNGHFLLTSLNPQGNANFSNLHEAIMGIKPGPNQMHARFISDKTSANPGDSIHFQDVSTGSPNSWQWRFNGSNTPVVNTQQVAGVVYSTPGIYPVKLLVGNGTSSDSMEVADYIRVLPLAGFRASSTRTELGGRIDFFDMSELANPATSWLWSFPGGSPSSSNQKNPAGIKYNSSGTYAVSLKVTTASGQHTLNIPQYIKVYNQCDTMMYCDVDLSCYVQPANAAAFQVGMFDLDQRVPYYASLGHTSSWVRFNKVLAPGDTNFFYGATSWFVPAGKANNYLVFGPLSIPASGAEFEWSHLYWLNHKRDGYEVLIGSGPNPSNFTGAPLASRLDNDPVTEGDTIWHSQRLSIPIAYNGQNVYLAFHHTANDMSYLFLDDFRLSSCTGLPGTLINPEKLLVEMRVIPNPAQGQAELTFPALSSLSMLCIYNSKGQLVLKTHIPASRDRWSIDIESWAKGLYLIELVEDGRRYCSRLIVQ